MPSSVDEILSILDLERLDADLFRGVGPDASNFFGGQVVGQALVAATRTIDGPFAHSLHGYFLRAAVPSRAIDFKVRHIRDGRSFATRQVDAVQNGKEIFCMFASFATVGAGLAHQFAMPQVAAPESLAKLSELPEDARRDRIAETLLDVRLVDFASFVRGRMDDGIQQVWLRVPGRLPDDPALHRAVLAYASDRTLWDTALLTLGRRCFDPGLQQVSVDHAVWFHRDFRADEWLLYHQDCPNVADGRTFNRGSFYSRDGRLVASAAQECLNRFDSPPR